MVESITRKLHKIFQKPYDEQALWYLYTFWPSCKNDENHCADVYKLTQAFIAIDKINGRNGSSLNGITAQKLLHEQGLAYYVEEFDDMIQSMDIDGNGKISLLEYLLHMFQPRFVPSTKHADARIEDFPTIENPDLPRSREYEELERRFNNICRSLPDLDTACSKHKELQCNIEALRKQTEEAVSAAIIAHEKAEACTQDADVKAHCLLSAQESLRIAQSCQDSMLQPMNQTKIESEKCTQGDQSMNVVDRVSHSLANENREAKDQVQKALEAREAEIERLTKISQDTSIGLVKRNIAIQELAQLNHEDTLPLVRAKITREAAERKNAGGPSPLDAFTRGVAISKPLSQTGGNLQKQLKQGEKTIAEERSKLRTAQAAARASSQALDKAIQAAVQAERKADEMLQKLDNSRQKIRDSRRGLENLVSRMRASVDELHNEAKAFCRREALEYDKKPGPSPALRTWLKNQIQGLIRDFETKVESFSELDAGDERAMCPVGQEELQLDHAIRANRAERIQRGEMEKAKHPEKEKEKEPSKPKEPEQKISDDYKKEMEVVKRANNLERESKYDSGVGSGAASYSLAPFDKIIPNYSRVPEVPKVSVGADSGPPADTSNVKRSTSVTINYGLDDRKDSSAW